MRILAVANQKGGCGKTTTSINLAAVLAELQKKILLIDLDPQGHTTCGLGVDIRSRKKNLYDMLTLRSGEKLSAAELVCGVCPNLSILPSDGLLYGLDEELVGCPDKTRRLKRGIGLLCEQKMDFDYIVIDCPPNLGVLTLNALEACDEVLIPIDPSFFSLHGLARMTETIGRVNLLREVPVTIYALLTLFDSRTAFSKDVYDDVKEHFRDSLLKTIIHECISLKEAASAGQSIVEYDRDSPGSRDYFKLGMEYLERQWDNMLPANDLGWDRVVDGHFGPKSVCGGMLFQSPMNNARSVEIAGDFNNWVPESLVFRHELGVWQKIIPLSRGAFRYKFIVDGEWQIDPGQPTRKENAFGSYDSYVEVA